jgi:hypothetical protein
MSTNPEGTQDITIPEAESHAVIRRCHTNSLIHLYYPFPKVDFL